MKLIKTMMKTASRQGFPPELKGLKWGNTEEVFNAEKTRMTQIPSANGHASARGELYMTTDGKLRESLTEQHMARFE